MAVGSQVQTLERAARKLDELLREASLYALRYGVGWDRVVELQGLARAYGNAIQEAHAARYPVTPDERRAA